MIFIPGFQNLPHNYPLNVYFTEVRRLDWILFLVFLLNFRIKLNLLAISIHLLVQKIYYYRLCRISESVIINLQNVIKSNVINGNVIILEIKFSIFEACVHIKAGK